MGKMGAVYEKDSYIWREGWPSKTMIGKIDRNLLSIDGNFKIAVKPETVGGVGLQGIIDSLTAI